MVPIPDLSPDKMVKCKAYFKADWKNIEFSFLRMWPRNSFKSGAKYPWVTWAISRHCSSYFSLRKITKIQKKYWWKHNGLVLFVACINFEIRSICRQMCKNRKGCAMNVFNCSGNWLFLSAHLSQFSWFFLVFHDWKSLDFIEKDF